MNRSSLFACLGLLVLVLAPALAAAQDPAAPPTGEPVRRVMRRAASPVTTQGDTAVLSARSVAGMPVVPIEINGRGPFWFALDTGTMGHGRVYDSLAVKLGLPVAGKVRSGDPSGKNTREVDVYRVDSLQIGGIVMRGAQMSGGPNIRQLKDVEGILGVDLFIELMLTIDYPHSEVRLGRSALPEANGRDVLSYSRELGPIVLPLQLGDRTLDTDLDTGNTVAPFIFPSEIAEALPRTGEPRKGRVARTSVNQVQMYHVTLADPLRLGALEFPGAEVAYPALHDRGNIGSQALGDCVLELDQENRRVRLTRTGTQAKAK